MSPIRITQLSDCHVSADPATIYRGQSADDNLVSVLDRVTAWDPDGLLLTGDVSEDASRESYQRVAEHVSGCGKPVWALPGNHDDPEVMAGSFGTGPWQEPLVVDRGSWRLVLLDSTERGRVSGLLSNDDLDWLRAELAGPDNRHYLLALHHQPLEVGAPWIDRYMLETPGPLLDLVDESDRVRCVVWGHIHHEFERIRSGTLFLGAPSTVANSLAGTEKFTLDPSGPAARWLQLYADGRVTTGLL